MRQTDSTKDCASLTTLVGGLAHEIRNPLSTINVNLQLLKEDWLDANTPRERRALRKLDRIQNETQRLQEILDDFLRFVRIEKLELLEHDLNELLGELADFITGEARLKNIEVIRFCDYNLPPCRMDRKFIKQAFLNILKNAQQAIEQDGQIMIRSTREGGFARVEITDTGPGMPAEMLEKIFQPYYSTKGAGTGLGLPTTKRIIEKHGGSIGIQSDPGHGTSVTVLLPLAGPGKADAREGEGNIDD